MEDVGELKCCHGSESEVVEVGELARERGEWPEEMEELELWWERTEGLLRAVRRRRREEVRMGEVRFWKREEPILMVCVRFFWISIFWVCKFWWRESRKRVEEKRFGVPGWQVVGKLVNRCSETRVLVDFREVKKRPRGLIFWFRIEVQSIRTGILQLGLIRVFQG